jgi:hypothetical protein
MGVRARIGHVRATELVLATPDRGISLRTVRRPELCTGHPCDPRPVLLGGIKIEARVEVHPYSKTGLVNVEEAPEPRAMEADHHRVRIGERHAPFALGPFTGVERSSRNEGGLVAQRSNTLSTRGVEPVDLGQLREMLGMGPSMWTMSSLRRGERDLADPEAHRGLADAEQVGDVSGGAVLGAEEPGLLLLLDLAAVARAATLANVRSVSNVRANEEWME